MKHWLLVGLHEQSSPGSTAQVMVSMSRVTNFACHLCHQFLGPEHNRFWYKKHHLDITLYKPKVRTLD